MLNDILKTLGILYLLDKPDKKKDSRSEGDKWLDEQKDYMDGVLYPGDRLTTPIYVNILLEEENTVVIETSFMPIEGAFASTQVKSISALKREIQEDKEAYEEFAEVIIRDRTGL